MRKLHIQWGGYVILQCIVMRKPDTKQQFLLPGFQKWKRDLHCWDSRYDIVIACSVVSSLGFSSARASNTANASGPFPNLKSASAFNARADCNEGLFLSTFSASCNAFLLFPLSNQSETPYFFSILPKICASPREIYCETAIDIQIVFTVYWPQPTLYDTAVLHVL